MKLVEYDSRGLRYLTLDIRIGDDEVGSFALELALLARGLSKRLTLLSPGEPTRLEPALTPTLSLDNGVHRVGLTPRELLHAIDFMLPYYADGAADVDHMHIELESELADDAEVTLYAASAKPFGTAEEARRVLLGED